MQKIIRLLAPFRYRLAMFLLLGAASVLSVALWRARTVLYDTVEYHFLIWNLFLAWIPLGLSYTIWFVSLRRTWLYIIIPAVAFLWLIFFPNAPYILTDWKHLADPNPDVPVWYDVLMLLWFSWTGLLLGIVSLYLMHNLVRREFGRLVGWGFVFSVSGLSSLGIYIGRFLRWNSWDLLTRPAELAARFVDLAQDPSLRSLGFVGLYTTFFLFIYITLYAFGHLLQERAPVETQP